MRYWCLECVQNKWNGWLMWSLFKSKRFNIAYVFEKFIKTSLKYYELDPCHYFSNSELSWDPVLKVTRRELEIISDIDMHLSMKIGMTGGISYIAKRFSWVNNK